MKEGDLLWAAGAAVHLSGSGNTPTVSFTGPMIVLEIDTVVYTDLKGKIHKDIFMVKLLCSLGICTAWSDLLREACKRATIHAAG